MAKTVKRSYVSAKRQEQAKATRWAVIQAATRLFTATGYAATTLQAIADEAGVAVQTIYAVFGNKRELLIQLIESAITGDDEPVPITERADAKAIGAEPDGARRAALDAAFSRKITERVAPIVRVAREAAASDPQFAPLYEAMKGMRRDEMVASARILAGSGRLRLGGHQAAATLYILYSPDVADMLVNDYGWSWDKYEKWLAMMLERTLIDE